MQLGGNDLCFPNTRPEVFARRINRGVNVQTCENRRTIVIKMLKAILDAEENMTFWRHLRLMNCPLDVLDKDDVHLTTLGTKKFFRSLRLALLHAIR